MKKCKAPKITKAPFKAKDFTRITFLPDYKRFQSDSLDAETYSILARRVYDIAGVTHKSLKVTLNGEKLGVDCFEKYVDMYINALDQGEMKSSKGSSTASKAADSFDSDEDLSDEEGKNQSSESSLERLKVYEKINDFWEICVTASNGSFGQVSFVNTVNTHRGGKHVDFISNLLVQKLADKLKREKTLKGATLDSKLIKKNLFVFINCLIVNPSFDSQSKTYLSTVS